MPRVPLRARVPRACRRPRPPVRPQDASSTLPGRGGSRECARVGRADNYQHSPRRVSIQVERSSPPLSGAAPRVWARRACRGTTSRTVSLGVGRGSTGRGPAAEGVSEASPVPPEGVRDQGRFRLATRGTQFRVGIGPARDLPVRPAPQGDSGRSGPWGLQR